MGWDYGHIEFPKVLDQAEGEGEELGGESRRGKLVPWYLMTFLSYSHTKFVMPLGPHQLQIGCWVPAEVKAPAGNCSHATHTPSQGEDGKQTGAVHKD
jgi:hypothetical protein